MGNVGGMTEGIILALAFVVLTGGVLAYLNSQYGETFSIGLQTDGLDDFYDATQTAYDSTTGEVTMTNDGLSLLSSWKMAKGLFGTAWSFINGSWISTLITDTLKLEGAAGFTIAMVIRVLFLSLILWSIIKLFFKVPF